MESISLLSVIKSRRSVRSFQKKPVPPDVIVSLLESIQWAPSGSNCQPWLAMVIQNEINIRKIKMFAPGLQGDPPMLLILCNDKSIGGITSIIDISMAAQNALLTATENGLGSCVVRGLNPASICSLLRLPSHVTPELIISIGYSVKSVTPPRRRPIEEFTHWERYGGQPNE